MSGGVDSSVASLLLMEQGYEVIGLTGIMSENSEKAVFDAKNVCETLGIRHDVLDLTESFNNQVIKYFENSYINGLTPNPCVFCNKAIKWGKMTDYVFNELGADFYATGHYARIINGRLYRALDLKKDQSYMLYGLTKEDLCRTIFPLGELNKPQIKEIASKNNLSSANNKESQDVCFIVPPMTTQSYLIEKFGEQTGEIISHKTGEILGHHLGSFNYTIGQRKGICVSAPESLYVVAIDHKENKIMVGYKDELFSDEFTVIGVNWQQDFTDDVMVKIRYNSPAQDAIMSKISDDSVNIKLKSPQSAVTPGQAAVFYDINNEYVVGGGIIESV